MPFINYCQYISIGIINDYNDNPNSNQSKNVFMMIFLLFNIIFFNLDIDLY